VKQARKPATWIVVGLPIIALAGLVIFKAELLPGGSTALSWAAPTETENGESLTGLAGYEIHCWASADQYMTTMRVDDPAVTDVVIEQLPPGSYKCAVSAFTASGEVSALSNVVAASVR